MSGATSQEVRLGLAGVAILVLLAVCVGKLTAPKPAPPPPKAHFGYHGLPDPYVDAEATEAEIKSLARRTRGDYSKLTHDEQVWIEGISANHGELTLAAMVKQLVAKPAHKKKPVEAVSHLKRHPPEERGKS